MKAQINLKRSVLKSFMIILFSSVLISCSSDDDNSSDYHFSIEGAPTELNAPLEGKSESYSINAFGPWRIKIKDKGADWLEITPSKGEDDEDFEISVTQNKSGEPRQVEIAFFLNGQEQPMYFFVNQESNAPFLNFKDEKDELEVDGDKSEFSIFVESNYDWSYNLEDADWLKEQEIKDNEIKFLAKKNLGDTRSTKITLISENDPELTKEMKIVQFSGKIIFSEDFSWLDPQGASQVIYKYQNEERFDLWDKETKEKNTGWEAPENTYSNDQPVYSRPGFIKLGKTNYGGHLISPKLDKLDEPTDVKVTFKAAPYQTKAGTRDDNKLTVEIIGDGKINKNTFTIDNWPNYDEDPESTEVWEGEKAQHSFKITGATANTKIKWMAGPMDLKNVGVGKNRIFLDDIKVEVIID